MGNVDLHVHSQVSDGSLTPEEIADIAKAKGVTVLAISDHDEVDGSIALRPLCEARGIRYIPAVEHSATYGSECYHILSYHADLTNPELVRLTQRARNALDGMSVAMIERMAQDDPRVSSDDFAAFERDPRLGGWKGIEYLMKRGVTESMTAGMRYYGQYGIHYTNAGFPSVAETIAAIHAAGGIAVLAHPGETLPSIVRGAEDERAALLHLLDELLDQGLDGIECHYPYHETWLTEACLERCRAKGLRITAGSDCHGTFQDTEIGELEIDESLIRL